MKRGRLVYQIDMSIQRMRQFVVVADEGTFGRAAERLGMAHGTALVPRAIARSLTVTGVEFRPIDFTDTVPIWPLALVHMPLAARSGASQLLARWRREELQLDEFPPPTA